MDQNFTDINKILFKDGKTEQTCSEIIQSRFFLKLNKQRERRKKIEIILCYKKLKIFKTPEKIKYKTHLN